MPMCKFSEQNFQNAPRLLITDISMLLKKMLTMKELCFPREEYICFTTRLTYWHVEKNDIIQKL
jgi:hypothetical protein